MHERDQNAKIILTVISAVIISFGIYFITISILVNPYLGDTQRLLNIFDFYSDSGRDEGEYIYFIGSSQIREGIDAHLIEYYLDNVNYSVGVYNLGYTSDTPLRRITELNYLIDSKPKLVIIGMSYYQLSNRAKIHDDHLALISDRENLDDYSKKLFNENELKQIKMNYIELNIYKRKFLFSSIKNLINHESKYGNENNFKNPYRYTENKTHEELINLTKSHGLLNWRMVNKDDNSMKKALNYTIEKLKAENIEVIIINMPLHPLLSETIPNTTKENYFLYLNSTGVNCYDFEKKYSQNYFIDLTHLNVVGRYNFSNEVAKIIYDTEKS